MKRDNQTFGCPGESRAALAELHSETERIEGELPPDGTVRPEFRRDCLPGGHNEQRPCPWVSCRYHLAIDVSSTGKLHFNLPDVDVTELEQSCALDCADEGGLTLDQIGARLGVTRERVRQLEGKAIRRLTMVELAQQHRPDGQEVVRGNRYSCHGCGATVERSAKSWSERRLKGLADEEATVVLCRPCRAARAEQRTQERHREYWRRRVG
jgi:hypothetical protein